MWMMLQADEPVDYVVGTGLTHSVQDLIDIAFAHVGIDPGAHVKQDPAFVRPAEVDNLIADPAKARDELGWEAKTSFEELIKLMVDADLELLREGAPVASS
jgi:GDPmannose 4,6-dehydratase